MRILFILLLLSIQGYAQQITTESYHTVEIRNPHVLTAPQVPLMIPNTPVIDRAKYWDADVSHFRDSLIINDQVKTSWFFHEKFNQWKGEDDPEYRAFIVKLCKDKHWINKNYTE